MKKHYFKMLLAVSLLVPVISGRSASSLHAPDKPQESRGSHAPQETPESPLKTEKTVTKKLEKIRAKVEDVSFQSSLLKKSSHFSIGNVTLLSI